MRKFALSAIAAALCTSPLVITRVASAQGNAAPPTVTPSTTGAKAPVGTDVVGSVNGKQITWNDFLLRLHKENPTDFDAAVSAVAGPKIASGLFGTPPQTQVTITQEEILSSIRQSPPAVAVKDLDAMLLSDAVMQEAAKQNINVSDSQADAKLTAKLQELRKAGQIPPTLTDDQFLTQQKVTREQIVQNFKISLILTEIVEKQLVSRLSKQFGHEFGPGDYVQARHILIKAPALSPTPKPEEKKEDAAALAKITVIATEIKTGKKTFAQAAKEYSDDGSKASGGELGVFMRGMMVPEFNTAVFTLKPDEVSKPIRTQYGYHLIQVEKLGKDLTPEQRKTLLDQRAQDPQMINGFVGELRQNIVNKLRPAVPAGPNGGPPQQPQR